MATVRINIRLLTGDTIALGPGKADLLEAILATGSISAAGRRMGLSYRRAWAMVETMNQAFAPPLVETVKGGAKGGGAALTDAGRAVLAGYRAAQAAASEAAAPALSAITSQLRHSRESGSPSPDASRDGLPLSRE